MEKWETLLMATVTAAIAAVVVSDMIIVKGCYEIHYSERRCHPVDEFEEPALACRPHKDRPAGIYLFVSQESDERAPQKGGE